MKPTGPIESASAVRHPVFTPSERHIVSPIALCVVILAQAAIASRLEANPWTRDQGSYYVNLNYSSISATSYYGPDLGADRISLGTQYSQHSVGLYGEVGLLTRWLTLTFDATLFRQSGLEDRGATRGFGDMRIGLWTGILGGRFRLAGGILLGIPSGDATPDADGGDEAAQLIAATLPTGDGETDVEGRLAFGYSFGGRSNRWYILEHYVRTELGYWLRSKGFADSVTYKAEIGTRVPYPIADRFLLILRFHGVESFASTDELVRAGLSGAGFAGLGNGVTHTSYGIEIFARVWRGIGVAVAADGAIRARNLPAGVNWKFALSYEAW